MLLDNRAVLITGASSGIGRQLCLDLAARGCSITLVDYDKDGADETLAMIQRAGGQGLVVQCDVASISEQEGAFAAHMRAYGRLDVAVLNAGIMEKGNITGPDPGHEYLQTLDVNLRAVAVGASIAVRTMRDAGARGGMVLMTASAGGLFPMPHAPVYAAAKAGVVHLARSLAPRLVAHGIRVAALCPQYADTPLVRNAMRDFASMRERVAEDQLGKILTVPQVTAAARALIEDDGSNGAALFISGKNGKWYSWPGMKVVGPPTDSLQPSGGASAAPWRLWAAQPLPSTYKKVELHRLSTDFAAATRVVSAPTPASLPDGCVLVRRMYAGVNASDINFSAGRYFRGGAASQQLPCDAGFEAVGVVARVGPNVKGLGVGDAVATVVYGGFSELQVVPARQAIRVAAPSPQVLALMVSGLTASIGLEHVGGVKPGSTVLVTAAAGGTGQFAVQLAKAAGATVVATCSSREKANMLRGLGADRVINYKTEDMKAVLRKEYPRGLDLVYESVGGAMFDAAVDCLASGGRVAVIGMVGQYSGEWAPSVHPGLAEKLLWKSGSVAGFFLLNHTRLFVKHLRRLEAMVAAGKLAVQMDARRFLGLESVAKAVEYLHSGQSTGKVYVQVAKEVPPLEPAKL